MTSKCKHCGEEIVYCDDDGYWDSFLEKKGKTEYWTIVCEDHDFRFNGTNQIHEPEDKEDLFDKIYKTLKYEV